MSDESLEQRELESSRSSSEEESSMHSEASYDSTNTYDTENEDSDREQHSEELNSSDTDNEEDSDNDEAFSSDSEIYFWSNSSNSNNVTLADHREIDRSSENDTHEFSLIETGNESNSEGDNSGSSSSTNSNEENYIFMSTEQVPLVKELMKKILKVSALFKERRESLPSFVHTSFRETRASLEHTPEHSLLENTHDDLIENNPSYNIKNGTSRENSVDVHEPEFYKKYNMIVSE